ncbi:MAG: circadian clock protein KaiC [Cyanophyceae cyanobacterium]
MNVNRNPPQKYTVEKLQTGIPGFDTVADGGLPSHSATLVAGTTGSAKTVLACQYLAAGITQFDQPGVLVTFEEAPRQICHYMSGFGWTIQQWEAQGKWSFVDASPEAGEKPVVTGEYELAPILARIEHAINKVGAKRLAVDALGAIFSYFSDPAQIRSEMYRIASTVKELGVTTLITAERSHEYGNVSRYGMEEFVADNVIILRNILEEEKRRRSLEILKFRGSNHQKGEFPFSVLAGSGIEVVPLSTLEYEQESTAMRIPSGIEELDNMCGGGFFRDSVVLVSGATGTGKTLIVTQFLNGGIEHQERCLLFAFEERREQLYRNARGWGVDFAAAETANRLKIVCRSPEATGLEEHLIVIKDIINRYQPNRVAIDSLSALERTAPERAFRQFIISITAFVKSKKMTGIFTSNTSSLLGGSSVTDAHISTITDSIILLRYVEVFGGMRRGIVVLKMRGSDHDKDIREFQIVNKQGMKIGHPFQQIAGILTGNFTYITASEEARLNQMFSSD